MFVPNLRRLKLIYMMLFSIVLAGCNSSNNTTYSVAQDANQRWINQSSSCNRGDRSDPKQAVSWVNCQKNAYSQFAAYDQNSDLIGLLLTRYAVTAEKFEKGKINSSEFNLAMQEAATEINSAIISRNNANSIAASQQAMANSARLQQFRYMQHMVNPSSDF